MIDWKPPIDVCDDALIQIKTSDVHPDRCLVLGHELTDAEVSNVIRDLQLWQATQRRMRRSPYGWFRKPDTATDAGEQEAPGQPG